MTCEPKGAERRPPRPNNDAPAVRPKRQKRNLDPNAARWQELASQTLRMACLHMDLLGE